MKRSTFLFILIPAIEIIVLLLSGSYIGIGWTVSLMFLTGIFGFFFAKRQGIQTLRRAQEQLNRGMMPGEELFNGICILAGAFLLLLPGFISDIAGLMLLIPITRKWVKPLLTALLWKLMSKSRGTIKIIR
ncbi:hypothetical protein AC622_04100 [Bacillus sp. FJAT-27916]|uniref:FxsA family protein n=1 Tax=Bacillaceae TaxID=186817 RepID=UPI000670F18E|nr:FxsA family protein [Bacillus sp. FJAT-27916]KMY43514.1 hypothetical protein AC622_04100 [Bacillus sp. FJAT-27916]